MIIARRLLKLASETGDINVPVTISAPEPDELDWICRFEIGWPAETRHGYAMGIDSMQALLLALQIIGAELNTSADHEDGRLAWLEPGSGYGFPVPASIRFVLRGDDARFF